MLEAFDVMPCGLEEGVFVCIADHGHTPGQHYFVGASRVVG
jgi:hypothetical protein